MPTNPVPNPNALAVFEEYKQTINQSLAGYFKELPAMFSKYNLPPIAERSLELIAEYTLRPGKRVRGALAAMAYDNLTGQHLSTNGQKLAIVMELIQSCALIEDDVTDRSDLRRGEPTVHRLYERYDNRITPRDAEQLAFYTGTITGYLFNLALLDIDEAAERLGKVSGYVQKNIILTSFGQLDDIMQETAREAAVSDIIRKYSLKTSHYTFVNPLQAGMALAGVDDQAAYDQVEKFGEAAGVAFQAHDDYLGVFGTEETGKPTTDDIKEGKLTILTEHAFSHASAADVNLLKSYMGNPAFNDQDLMKVRAIFDKSGATIEAQQAAKHYAEEAVRQLSAVKIWDDTFKSLLAELVTYSVSRKS